MNINMFKGLYTALITPFTERGDIDFKSLADIIEFQMLSGVDGIVVCGTTGESATLSEDEQNELIKQSVKIANKRTKIIAGAGSNCTIKAIRLTQKAQNNGVDGVLIVAPYYNKPNQQGIFEHYKAIHDASNVNIILYNVPARTVTNIADETSAKLANLPRIVSLKDASGDLARVYNLQDKLTNKNFTLLSGEDMTAVSFNASGGHGVISVTSNVLPFLCKQVQALCEKGDFIAANKIQQKLTKINKIMFNETNPIMVKHAMYLMGYCSGYVRLPLTKPNEENIEILKEEMKALELIK